MVTLWSVGTAVNSKMNQKEKFSSYVRNDSRVYVDSYCHRTYEKLCVSFMFKLLGEFIELIFFFLLVN